MARQVILIGLIFILAGLVWFLFPEAPTWFSWFGHLPGDFQFSTGGFDFYLPFVSMLLVSLVLTLIAWLLLRA